MSVLNNLIRHPRRFFLRRVLFQVHLWMGVALSLYLILISLSGALLVYHTALTRTTLPHGLSAYDAAHTASVPTVVSAAQTAFPHAVVTNIDMPYTGLPAFMLDLRDGAGKEFHAAGDPQTGRVVLTPRSWVDVVYDFHLYLLLQNAHGMQWNGAGAAGLLVLAMTGILLWWRGLKGWWRGLVVSLRHNWRRVNYDLHHAIGFWTLAIVFWWALSGVYFAWYQPFTNAVNAVSPLQGMQEPKALAPPKTPQPATLQAIVDAAQKASPHGWMSSISNPTLMAGEDVYAYMNLRTPRDFAHADVVKLDAKSGAVMSVWHYGQNRSAGDWVIWAMEPVHFGSWWGPWMQALWCLFGVSLAVLTASGLVMYWNRWLRFRWRELSGRGA